MAFGKTSSHPLIVHPFTLKGLRAVKVSMYEYAMVVFLVPCRLSLFDPVCLTRAWLEKTFFQSLRTTQFVLVPSGQYKFVVRISIAMVFRRLLLNSQMQGESYWSFITKESLVVSQACDFLMLGDTLILAGHWWRR